MKFTIITPIFNRASFVKRLYDNISVQKGKIQWILVNDGSQDSVDIEIKKIQEISKHQSNENLQVQYLKKENGGKHTAVNLGLRFANGDWTIILDSDDLLTKDCIETLIEKITSTSQEILENISGFIFLKQDTENKIVGQSFLQENQIMYHYDLAKVKGDKFRLTKTSLLKENKFPTFENEKFVTESTVWNQIESKNPLVCFNQFLLVGEYLEGGLTNSYDRLIEENPKGTFHYVKTTLQLTSWNIFRDIGLYRSLFGHYFHVKSYDKNVQILKNFKTKGVYFLFWFYIYRVIAYIFYNDFKETKKS